MGFNIFFLNRHRCICRTSAVFWCGLQNDISSWLRTRHLDVVYRIHIAGYLVSRSEVIKMENLQLDIMPNISPEKNIECQHQMKSVKLQPASS